MKEQRQTYRASHDAAVPQALIDFMLQGWRPPRHRKVAVVQGASHYKKRRAHLSAAFPGDIIIVPTGREKVRANDTHYTFRPGSDFFYLTGNAEPDGVLVLMPGKGGHRSVLFVDPNPGRSDPAFFTDRNKGELWVGPRLGVPESLQRFGMDEAAPLPELADTLRRCGAKRFRGLRGLDPLVDSLLPKQKQRDGELATYLSEARLIKDAFEIAALVQACAISRRGFDDIVRSLKGAKSERELEGVFNARARLEGNNVGYNVIAAAGAHACILHWNRNDGALNPNELVLIDAGVEGPHLYTADITRVLPMGGRFSKEQREITQLVVAAQLAAIAAVEPGADFLAPHRAAMRVLAEGLEQLGLLKVPAAQALDESQQTYRRYTLHGTSHMLGIDVHDCPHARAEHYRNGKLRPGMVLTVEPGLYFQLDDLTVPKRYRGIGVRIEDDVLVTASGRRVLSDVPKAPSDVEAWMATLWREAA